jgi:hypothetical protein
MSFLCWLLGLICMFLPWMFRAIERDLWIAHADMPANVPILDVRITTVSSVIVFPRLPQLNNL